MAFSREENFALLPRFVAKTARPFSHPARIRILLYLLENGDTAFHTLTDVVPLHRTTISQHLRMLRRSGLIDGYERYPHTYYSINEDQVRKHMLILEQFLIELREHGIDSRDL